MNPEPVDDSSCLAGRPPRWWERRVPLVAWMAWSRLKAHREAYRMGRELGDLARSDVQSRRLVLFQWQHLKRLDAAQKDRLIEAWRDVLGIERGFRS